MIGSYEFHKMYQAAGAFDVASAASRDFSVSQPTYDKGILQRIAPKNMLIGGSNPSAGEAGGMSTVWLLAGVAGLGAVGYLVFKAVS